MVAVLFHRIFDDVTFDTSHGSDWWQVLWAVAQRLEMMCGIHLALVIGNDTLFEVPLSRGCRHELIRRLAVAAD